MPRLMPLVLAGLVAIALNPGSEAKAGYVSGWDLLEVCKATPGIPSWQMKTAECFGYVVGVADTFDCQDRLHGFTWDSATKVPQQDVVKTVVDWLSHHPATLQHESDGLVAAALHETYPCH